jgi:uncharacterized membrane protein HdeD (DUF308 family)
MLPPALIPINAQPGRAWCKRPARQEVMPMDVDVVVPRFFPVRWWAVALRGLCAIIFGALALLAPGITLLVLTIWFAAFMAVDGALALIAGIGAAMHHKHGLALIAEGLLGLIAAAIVLAWPGVGIAGFVLLAAFWAVMTGAALLWGAVALPLRAGRFLMGSAAILSVLLGVLLVAHPIAAAVALAWWLGAYALVSGVLLLALAVRLRSAHAGVLNEP